MTGTTPGGLAECTESSGSDCIYTCENISYTFDCLPQCDGLVGDNPSRNVTGGRGIVTFSQDPVAYPNPFKDEINIANLPIEEKRSSGRTIG